MSGRQAQAMLTELHASRDPYAWIRSAVDDHRRRNNCAMYPFDDPIAVDMLISNARPRAVLELGTLLGYTACSWAAAGSTVLIIEPDGQHARLARATTEHAGLASRVQVVHSPIDEALAQTFERFDVVLAHQDALSAGTAPALPRLLTPRGLLVLPGAAAAVVADLRHERLLRYDATLSALVPALVYARRASRRATRQDEADNP